jgi:hypothetical protein
MKRLRVLLSRFAKKKEEKEEKKEEATAKIVERMTEEILDQRLENLEAVIQDAAKREVQAALNEQASLLGMQFIKLGDLMREVLLTSSEVLGKQEVDTQPLQRLREVYSAGINIAEELAANIEKVEQELSDIREAKEWIEASGKAIIELKAEMGRVNSELREMQARYEDLKERLKEDLSDAIAEKVLADMVRYGVMNRIREDVVNAVMLRMASAGWDSIRPEAERYLEERSKKKEEELKAEVQSAMEKAKKDLKEEILRELAGR